MGVPVIVIDGGPCGGKSTFLVHVREWLEKYGVHPLVISETATELITAGAGPSVLGFERFQEKLLLYSLEREKYYLQLAQCVHMKKVIILCDRGVLDCAAYMGKNAYRTMLARLKFSQDELRNRYQMVIHLVTAAEGAEEFYTLANNTARSESAEDARTLDLETQRAWLGHPHHVIIDNSTDFAGKMRRALRSLARMLDMPEPTEIERKFRVMNFKMEFIPASAVAVAITQDYLVCGSSGERRVRKRVCDGEASYFYTEKMPTDERATRVERERQVSEAEYLTLLRERDTACMTIRKVRYYFPSDGKLFELDVYEGNYSSLVVLEVELQRNDEEVRIPLHWDVIEVTDEPAFKNHALARR